MALTGQKIPLAQYAKLNGLSYRFVKAQVERHSASAGQILLQFVQQALVGIRAHRQPKSCSLNAIAYLR
ncbi:Uncharacterised protein [Serratia fonticola]|uniref:Uncharacterized protein n=1 Tax=Serratia fonticola TaxID=47917 RepID=A0A4U9W5D5_SERFO|nr:Uncharacterised protein [Serratia fonticola]